MIEIRLENIRKMLPEGWTAEADDDGVIVVIAPPEFSADMPAVAAQFIREIEQPLTLMYTLTISDAAVLAAAQAQADSYGLALREVGQDKYQVVRKDTPPLASQPPRIQGGELKARRKGYVQPENVISVTTTGDGGEPVVKKIIDSVEPGDADGDQ